MASDVVTGAFALGGVALGGALDWLRGSIATRAATGSQRDELFAALGTACTKLMLQIRLVQQMALPKVSSGIMATQFRENLPPVLTEITVLSTKLSMSADGNLRSASRRVSSAAALLLEHGIDKGEQQEREDELKNALEQLRDARDLSASRWPGRRQRKMLPSSTVPEMTPSGESG